MGPHKRVLIRFQHPAVADRHFIQNLEPRLKWWVAKGNSSCQVLSATCMHNLGGVKASAKDNRA